MRSLKLRQNIIYGPVASRRFGPSLGINLLSTEMKVCSFNCIYCHYGWTLLHKESVEFTPDHFPTVPQVEKALIEAVDSALDANTPPNVITFSGNGEPTIHPYFPDVVDAVLAVRDRMMPGVSVQVLSNSTTLDRPEVVKALRRLDRRVMKLDAGTEELFRGINRPVPGLTLARVTEGLRRLGGVTIQSAFMAGRVDNSGNEAVASWLERLRPIEPLEVQIYTLDRPPADAALERVLPERLQEIAKLVRRGGIKARVF